MSVPQSIDAGALSGMGGWDSVWNQLPEDVTALRFSRRGEGRSSGCTQQLSVADYVDDVERLLERLSFDMPFIYVAHSLGGAIAREYAARNSENVLAMLFIDPSNPRDVEIIRKLNPAGGDSEVRRIKQSDYAAGNGKWCFLDVIWDKSEAPGFKQLGDVPVTLIAGIKEEAAPNSTFNTGPARRLWGQYQEEWASQFPRGKTIITDKSGHFVQDDEPDLVINEIKQLIKYSSSVTP